MPDLENSKYYFSCLLNITGRILHANNLEIFSNLPSHSDSGIDSHIDEVNWTNLADDTSLSFRNHFQEACLGNKVILKHTYKQGNNIYSAETLFKPIQDNDGNTILVLIESKDTTRYNSLLSRLEESQRTYQELAENIPGFVYQFLLTTEGEYAFKYVSNSCRDIYEIPAEEFLNNGMAPFAYIVEEDLADIHDSIIKSANNLTKWQRDFRIVTHSGKQKWLRGISSPNRQPDGCTLWNGVCMDITEEALTKEKLRLEQDIFAHIYSAAETIIVILSLEGLTLNVNQAVTTITGYDVDELVGKNWWEIFYPGQKQRQVEKLYLDFANGGIVNNYEMTLQTKLGEDRIISWNSANKVNANGEITEIIGIGADVTEKIQALESIERLAAIVQSSEDAIIGVDLAGKIIDWNKGAETMYGFRAEEVIGEHQNIIVPGELQREAEDTFASIISGENVARQETIRRTKLNENIDVSITSSPIKNSLGQIIGVSSIARDITERKIADRRVSEFYSMVSHELRTPLSSIKGAMALLNSGIMGKISLEAKELVEIAIKSCDRLIRLINDILDVKKIESGKLNLKASTLNPELLFDAIIQDFKPKLQEKNIQVNKEVLQVTPIEGDFDRIYQVLTNLTENAIKFSDPDSIISLKLENTENNMIKFSISDRGPGIPDENIPQLFKMFQQLDSSDTRAKGGTGLGLAICKAIVEQHGGQIGVETKPGQGSTFWFKLPQKNQFD